MNTLSLDLRGVEAAHALPREGPALGASVSLLLHTALISTLVLIPLLPPTSLPEAVRAVATPLFRPITVTLPSALRSVAARPQGRSTARSASAVVPVPSVPGDLPTSLPTDKGITLDPLANFEGSPPGDPYPGDRIGGTCPLGSLCATAVVPIADPPRPVVRIGGVIREPRLMEGRAPIYPPIAQAAGVAGRVVLEAHVGPDGRVREVRIVEGHTLFNEAALASMRSRRYEPLRLNDVPTDFLITITVAFNVR